MTEKNKETLQKANEAIARGEYEAFLAYCTEDTTWKFIGDQVLRGKEAVRAYMQKTYLAPPVFDVDSLLAEEDYVAAIGKISLKDRSGTLTHYDYCDVWRFRDGLMSELRAFVVPISE